MQMLQSAGSSCALGQDGQWLLEQMVPLSNEYLNSCAVPATADWQPLAGAEVGEVDRARAVDTAR
jgi:hypothetical protein